MISVFDFEEYKAFLRSSLEAFPQKGRGQTLRLAEYISAHPTLVSQVLNGDRDFSAEQIFKVAQYLGLKNLETEYLISLLQIARAGTHEYKVFHQNKMKQLKRDSLNVAARLDKKRELSDLDRSVFYSNWIYMAVWIFIAVDGGQTLDAITEKFKISRALAKEVTEFFMSCGLAISEGNKFKNKHQHIHLEFGSPYLSRHHMNWRVRSLERVDDLSPEELMFTSPFSVSRKDFMKIREEIIKVIQTTSMIIKESPEEDVACMNFDLFWIKS